MNNLILKIILLTAIFAFIAILAMLDFPKSISVNDGNIQLNTHIGKPRLIPLDKIEIIEMQEGLLSNLFKTYGTGLGKYKYGYFKNTKTGQKMFLFLTGKPQKTCFMYNGKMYVTDDWHQ